MWYLYYVMQPHIEKGYNVQYIHNCSFKIPTYLCLVIYFQTCIIKRRWYSKISSRTPSNFNVRVRIKVTFKIGLSLRPGLELRTWLRQMLELYLG